MAQIFDKKNIRYLLITLSLFAVLIIGNRLREFSYSEVPGPGETNDEYSFAWLGISLLRDGYPTAWSGIPGYKTTDYQRINVDGIFNNHPEKPDFPMNRPWFDHPPLFGLLIGGYAYFKGVREFVDASVIIIRRPMLKIALLTSLLIFILGWKLYGWGEGILASLLYSTIPLMVISSRLVLAENGYIPLWLLSAIFAILYFDKKFCINFYQQVINRAPYLKRRISIKGLRRLFWGLSLFFAGLAILFKLSAIAITIFLLINSLLFSKGKERKHLVFSCFLAAIIPLVIFLIFGAYYDLGVFINILKTNSGRFFGVGPEIVFRLINGSSITKSFNDGWLLLGWISIILLAYTEWKKNVNSGYILSAFFSYLFVFIIFGSEPYGWYRFPFFPFLVLAITRVLTNLFKTGSIFLFSILMMLPIGTALNRLVGINDFQVYVPIFREVVVFVFSLFVLSLFIRSKKLEILKKGIMIIVFLFTVWLSINLVYFYNINRWYLAA